VIYRRSIIYAEFKTYR